MLSSSKVIPIHSHFLDKGKRTPISEKVKRNNSCINSQKTTPMIDTVRKTSNATQRKPQSAIVTVRNYNTTPTNFITSCNPFEQIMYNQDRARTSHTQEGRRKSSYLSRRFIHKKMLESYIDNVFHKVSLIRATEDRLIGSFSRRKKISMSQTARWFARFLGS